MSEREPYVAARVVNALLREDYGGLADRVTRTRDGVALELPGARRVRLTPGSLYQDFVVAPDESLGLSSVLGAVAEIAHPADAAGVKALAVECGAALRALELHDARRDEVLGRIHLDPRDRDAIDYETLAAFVDHPVYPTARARYGMSEAELLAYAPEFAPSFELRWAAVPRERARGGRVPFGPSPADVGLPGLAGTHVPFPVHPLSVRVVGGMPGVTVGPVPYLRVRPTLSMRTVEAAPGIHLKLPLATSTLGLRNRRSIKPATLGDGALAERLLREVLAAEPEFRDAILLADEQRYGHADHEYLAWMVRTLPDTRVIPVAALLAPSPAGAGETVIAELARARGGDVTTVLGGYLRLLLRWNVRLFVKYGIALEAHQQNISLVASGPPRLLIKDNDGLLASPERLRAAGLAVPRFADERMLTDDPHALADVFVTITLHLAAAAVAFGALPADAARRMVRDALADALAEHGDDPLARLLRARTLDAARLVGKAMLTAGTLVDKARTGAADVNKFYGTGGPNYLRRV
ncbi:IucA/IucC family protein [Spongiactinospora sp. TRM90649]|uniref:IucA/IucC family protein n=1 Tax=Spongiactinospora sp. TRM90649 TaxID=3031114 RepID=UPI0023F89D2F|nr:IucA/IucC family protein [Spongiactinospora sp. TRM90649]MDF5755521.1 IucA/IucC family protein [Spongiactinospora sp. TRM90649]